MLLIFGGLPGSGKSTISKRVASTLGAVYIRVDTIEDTLREAGFTEVHSEGYELAYKIAADNLALGLTVIADSVNSISITRDAWRTVGDAAEVPVLELEIICSNQDEHKRRLERRAVGSERAAQLTWDDVLTREYEPWPQAHIVIDTAGDSPEQSFEKTLSQIKL